MSILEKPALFGTESAIKKILMLISLSFVFPISQQAQWKSLNPIASVDVTSMTNLGSHVFVGTSDKGIYHSTNNGDLWSASNAGLTDFNVTALITAGSNVLAGTKYGGVFKYSGKNWANVNICSEASVYSLGFCGTNIYAGVNNSIYQSADYGATWKKVKDFGFDTTVTSITFYCCNVFAGTNKNAIFTSIDNGTTWKPMKNSPPSINTLIEYHGTLYAGTDVGVFYSDANNLDGSWQNLGGFYLPVVTLSFSGNDLLTGTKGYGIIKYITPIWISANAGIYDRSVSSILVNGSNIFIGTKKYGIYSSTNNAISWSASNNGLIENSVRDMALDGSNLFVLMNNDKGVYKTSDDGVRWQQINNGLKSFKGFTFITKYNNQIFVGGLNGFYQTPTFSTNWVKSTLDQTIRYLFVDNKNYYAGGVDNFDETLVYYSNDSGATWNCSHLMAFGFVNNFHKVGTRLLAGHQSSGVLKSDDGGKNWSETSGGLDNAGAKNVWKIGETNNYLFAATHGSIYRTQKSISPYQWQQAAFFNTDIYDMLVTKGDTIYVAPYGEGVYVSSNGGDSWWSENDGLLDLNIISLAESGGSKIYCSSLSGGIYSRTKSTITSVGNESPSIPSDIKLYQNYPNPFNPTTTIQYQVATTSFVKISVFDVLGKEIESLINREQSPGNYKITFNGSNLSSGIYFYQLRAGDLIQTKKMILMK